MSGTVAVTGNVTMDTAVPLVAVAGSTTSVSVIIGNAVSFSLFSSVTGGYPPYTYSILSGTLPQGLTLNSSLGIVSGTTTALYSSANVVFVVRDYFNIQAATTVTVNFAVLNPTYSINYLVVAGGGGGGIGYGGSGGNGGGAGGVLAGAVSLTVGTDYTITVGAGGNGARGSAFTPPDPPVNGQPGVQSSITAPGFTTIASTGGGGGAGQGGGTNQPGGSGAGGPVNSATFGTATGSPGAYGVAGTQGYPGGRGDAAGFTSGGGGGAGGSGQAAAAPGSSAGAGGPGVVWPFNGTFYGGGGGGGGTNFGTPPITRPGAPGGAGGGGAGPTLSAGTPGCINTGGGGGGGGWPTAQAGTGVALPGGNGGPGVIILAVPTANYPGSAPGATITNPPAAPGMTVLRYASPGTYRA